MPYVLDTSTSRANPTAVSHAVDTKIMIGIGNMIIECEFNEVMVAIVNRGSIIPSRHKSVGIRWEQNISVPRSENVKASMMLKTVVVILVIMI